MAYFIPIQYLLDEILKLEKYMNDQEFAVFEALFDYNFLSHKEYLWLSELHEKLLEIDNANKKNLIQKSKLWN